MSDSSPSSTPPRRTRESRGSVSSVPSASRATRVVPRVELKPGLNSFEYIDPKGRCVPVHYYLPSQFPTDPVDELAESANVREEEEDWAAVPDPADLAEEVAEDESDVEDDAPDDDVVVSTILEGAADREETEDFEKHDGDNFESELFTSQDILFVMHGVLRDAHRYCQHWSKLARRFNVLIVCPEFNATNFPDTWEYNMGAMEKGGSKDSSSFMAIERIFEILNNSGVRRKGYHLYGHSAGSQFAHRFTLFMPPSCHLVSTIAANAGWYTLPERGSNLFPYSLRRAPWPVTDRQLQLAFSRRLIVMLGQEDNTVAFLRRTAPAMQQGSTRFERGINFFLTAKRIATEMKTDFNWSLRTVPLVGHANRKMALAAAKELFFVPPQVTS